MADNFFAYLKNGEIRKISLLQTIENSIRNSFIEPGEFFFRNKAPILFDGNYNIEEDEILYVNMDLPDVFNEIKTNPTGLQLLNLESDVIKSLCWYENDVFYFQNFDSRKLLKNKNVLFYSRNTYGSIENNAFIVDDHVHAIYENNRFLFLSYANANKIFNLSDFFKEATDEEVGSFAQNNNIALEDNAWFITHSNTVIRKQITLIHKSGILNAPNTKKIKIKARKFNINIELDAQGKIKFPRDIKICRNILFFLNEQFYAGLISGTPYRTNSKIKISN